MDRPELPSHEYGIDDINSWNKKLFDYASDMLRYSEYLEEKLEEANYNLDAWGTK